MPTVIVGCKLPNGLIMELIKPGPLNMPTPPSKRVTLAGANSLRTSKAENPLVSRYAMTPVDEEFAREWFKQNAQMDFVKAGAVFIAKDAKEAQAEAKEKVDEVKTGLEPLNPDKDARLPRGVAPDKNAGVYGKRDAA